MKRTIYIILCVATLGLTGYTTYYAMSHTAPAMVAVEAPAPVATTTPLKENTTSYTTKSGKKIKITETNPIGESLSTITITPEGFATNTPIVLDVNKLTNSLYADLNNDIYEELIITTTAQGSGSFGDVFIFTTASATQLLPIPFPEVTEDETKKGALFEGYMGHDSFSITEGKLIRVFPTYTKTDTNNDPTGTRRSVVYSLAEKGGTYSIVSAKGIVTSTSSVKVSTTTLSQ